MVILYSTHCPKCQVLEKKLDQKNIKYDIIDDEELMINKGFINVPILEVGGEKLNFKEAVDWVARQE